MDLKMRSEVVSSSAHPVWDFAVEDGIVPILSGSEEDMQAAILAGFLEKGTVPQLPNMGVPWTEFLTKEISFGELDSLVRQSIQDAGKEEYYPKYDIEKDSLTMTVGCNME